MSKLNRRIRIASVETIEGRLMFSQTAALTTDLPVNTHSSGTIFPADATPVLSRGPRRGDAKITPLGYSSPSGLGLTATQMRGGYGLGSIGTGNISFNGVKGDGTGQTIALIDLYNDPTIQTDLATFDAAEGLPSPPSFQVLNQNGQTSPLPSNSATSGQNDWSSEESLDVEWAHAIAPGANLILFESTNLVTANATAAAYPGVSVVSNSWGSGESSNEASSSDPYFTTPSGHAGVSFFASTGDTGAEVSYPAESDNVIAVGGTAISLSGNSWSSETTWNSGGGGTSAYETQPTWQAGTVTSSKRQDPDISMDASPNTGVPIVDSWDNTASAPWSGVWGGTSLSSPMMAALVAIADQGRAAEGLTPLSGPQSATRLYQLSKANFHDITTGSNGHAATVGYDEATGIGSPIANVLIPNLAGAGTVTGRMFVDNTGSGVFNSSDTPLAGRGVYLDLNNDGSLDNGEPSTTTNASGLYTFTDQPAGGVIRQTTATPAGYTTASPAAPSITYGATDTANFIYTTLASKLAFTQQPPSTVTFGSSLGTVAVSVQTTAGATVGTDHSVVTLSISSGTFNTGSSSLYATAVNGVATFSNLQLNGVVGSYTLTATDGILTAAQSNTFSVTQATPQITWATPAPITYGAGLGVGQLNATANVPGSFSYTPARGAILSAGAGQVLSVTFNPSDPTDYTTASATTTITVLKATPVVTWAAPASITSGTALSATQLDATANVAGTFAYTPGIGTVLGTGTGQVLTVAFTPTDSTDYNVASATTSITVTGVVPINLSAPAFYVKRVGPNLDIWTNSTGTGAAAVDQSFDTVGPVTLSATSAGNAFVADFSAGSVVPDGGLTFNGFGPAAGNSLTVIGTGAADAVTVPGDGTYHVNAQTIAYSAGTIGNVFFQSPGAGESLTVPTGTVTLAPSTSAATESFDTLSVGAGASVVVPTAAAPGQKVLVRARLLQIAGTAANWTGTLDLSDNDLDLTGGNLADVASQIAQGTGNTTGGIVSSAALANTTALTTLGMIQNTADGTTPLFGTGTNLGLFDGVSPAATDVLVRYTYFGDANLDGTVDGSDYSRLDSAFLSNAPAGWLNGDFNHDGVVDGSDYTLIDNSYNRQTVATPSAVVAAPSTSATSDLATDQRKHKSQAVAAAAPLRDLLQ